MKAIRVHEFGGSEVLRFEEVTTPQPGQGSSARSNARAGSAFWAVVIIPTAEARERSDYSSIAPLIFRRCSRNV
jgi:hypothetical protein